MDAARFRAKYGPWALVAGASEGIGEAFADEIALRGLNVVLVARRPEPLAAAAGRLRDRHGVETRAVALDLSTDDAPGRLIEATANLEIGFLVYNAAYSVIGRFVDLDLDVHLKTLATNCRTPMVLTHHFGRLMAARGRGGIVWMSSMSSLQGSAMVGSYAATKAFDRVIAESQWDELRERGVDVLACVAGATRTPNYLASEPKKPGAISAPEMEPGPVAREALAALGKRPSLIPGRANRAASFFMTRLLPRKLAVEIMGKTTRGMYDKS